MDLINNSLAIECAVALTTLEENHVFINETVSSAFGPFLSFFKSFLRSQHNILPLVHISAVNHFRNALNQGVFTEETRYISFTLKDRTNGDAYLTYGQITAFTSLIPKEDAEDIAINIKLLNGKEIIAVGPDLYNIAVSQNSREAFEQQATEEVSTPKIKIDDDVLAPFNRTFRNGRILEFIGDQVRVYFKDPLNHKNIIKLIPIKSLKHPLQIGDSILVHNQDSYHPPYKATILEIMDDETLLVTIKDGESEFKRVVQPEEIVEILQQSRHF